ncbi:MAG: hypothetical protein KGQ46_07280 [Hyphomicrobiales bacterium]|nr:hypothetical protein [Hyphomicrobiales bacterium]MDE2113991.1 hypothetical protein [Hyphomicrobiales bacterium]
MDAPLIRRISLSLIVALTTCVSGVCAAATNKAAMPDNSPKPISTHASDEQLRQCAEKWQAMKRDGSAAGLLWYNFAATCLKR